MPKKHKTTRVAVLGAGNMGTTIAQVLADNGHKVGLWNFEGDQTPLKQIQKYGENRKYLPGIKLYKNITPYFDIKEALHGAKVVFFIVASPFMGDIAKTAAPHLPADAVLITGSKGLHPKSLDFMVDMIKKNVPASHRSLVGALSGPAVAVQMVHKGFTAMDIASKNPKVIKRTKQVLENTYIRLVPTSDVVGVELGGAFKNVFAILMGVCDGLGISLNTKAALLTGAVREMAQLSKALGGKEKTMYGLAGLGDLIGTSFAEHSRNRRFGDYLGKGLTRSAAVKKVGQVVEGVYATETLLRLARRKHVKLPFAELVLDMASERGKPKQLLDRFLRSKKVDFFG